MVERCREVLTPSAHLIFTAHSIPVSMAQTSCYQAQIEEACRLVAAQLAHADWRLVYQSRSGSPAQPWLGPDICEYLKELDPGREVVIAPIGFLSDHMEVIYDLDTEARQLCDKLGIKMVRAETVGVHPKFVSMIRDLVRERTEGSPAPGARRPGPQPRRLPAGLLSVVRTVTSKRRPHTMPFDLLPWCWRRLKAGNIRLLRQTR